MKVNLTILFLGQSQFWIKPDVRQNVVLIYNAESFKWLTKFTRKETVLSSRNFGNPKLNKKRRHPNSSQQFVGLCMALQFASVVFTSIPNVNNSANWQTFFLSKNVRKECRLNILIGTFKGTVSPGIRLYFWV